ncbi:hypothetical protein D9M72_305210 [compost metagenome]
MVERQLDPTPAIGLGLRDKALDIRQGPCFVQLVRCPGVKEVSGRQRFSKREGFRTRNLAPDVPQAAGAVIAARSDLSFCGRTCRGKRICEVFHVQAITHQSGPVIADLACELVSSYGGQIGVRHTVPANLVSGGLQGQCLGRRHIVRLVHEPGGQEERPAHAGRDQLVGGNHLVNVGVVERQRHDSFANSVGGGSRESEKGGSERHRCGGRQPAGLASAGRPFSPVPGLRGRSVALQKRHGTQLFRRRCT